MKIIVGHSKCGGTIDLPASKSYMHRAIIASCLAKGESIIKNITLSEDIDATIDAFKVLGADIKEENDTLIIKGIKDFNSALNSEIDCNNSGSTLRFLIPILSLFNISFTLRGSKSLFSRPLDVYKDIYNKEGLKFDLCENYLDVSGRLRANEYVLKGNISSQFISGLLFVLPLLEGDSIIKIIPPLESESYINMTIKVLKDYGIEIIRESRYEFFIKGNQEYKSREYYIEKDFSQFAFFGVLGAINNGITCKGLNINSLQGDRFIIDILRAFNVKVDVNGDEVVVHKCNNIQGCNIDLKDCPDLGPILMVLSLFSKNKVCINNINRLRIKESNRVESMVDNLRKLNAKIDVSDNELVIYPSKIKRSREILESYNDHRVMMAMVVLATCIRGYTIIDNPLCVKKSYVNFYRDMQRIGADIGLHD